MQSVLHTEDLCLGLSAYLLDSDCSALRLSASRVFTGKKVRQAVHWRQLLGLRFTVLELAAQACSVLGRSALWHEVKPCVEALTDTTQGGCSPQILESVLAVAAGMMAVRWLSPGQLEVFQLKDGEPCVPSLAELAHRQQRFQESLVACLDQLACGAVPIEPLPPEPRGRRLSRQSSLCPQPGESMTIQMRAYTAELSAVKDGETLLSAIRGAEGALAFLVQQLERPGESVAEEDLIKFLVSRRSVDQVCPGARVPSKMSKEVANIVLVYLVVRGIGRVAVIENVKRKQARKSRTHIALLPYACTEALPRTLVRDRELMERWHGQRRKNLQKLFIACL